MWRLVLTVLLALDLNTATVRELETLPEVGPVLAGRIVEFRKKLGGYRKVEELLAVPGISERLWRILKERVEVRPVRN